MLNYISIYILLKNKEENEVEKQTGKPNWGLIPITRPRLVSVFTGKNFPKPQRNFECETCGFSVAAEWVCCPYCGKWLDWDNIQTSKSDEGGYLNEDN
jgi:hypothetical protein